MTNIEKINQRLLRYSEDEILETLKMMIVEEADQNKVVARFKSILPIFKRLLKSESEEVIENFIQSLYNENHVVDNEPTFKTFEQIKSKSRLSDIAPKWMSKTLLNSILNFDEKNAIGKGELLLTYILKDAEKPIKGDIKAGDLLLECKVSGGKILDNLTSYKESLVDLMKELQTILKPLNESKHGVYISDLDTSLEILKKYGYNKIADYFKVYSINPSFALAKKNTKNPVELKLQKSKELLDIHKHMLKIVGVIKTNYLELKSNSVDVIKAMGFFEDLFNVMDNVNSGCDIEADKILVQVEKIFFYKADCQIIKENKNLIELKKVVDEYLNDDKQVLTKNEIKASFVKFINESTTQTNAISYLFFRPSSVFNWDYILEGIHNVYKENSQVVIDDLFNSIATSILYGKAIEFKASDYPVGSSVSRRYKTLLSDAVVGYKLDYNKLFELLGKLAFERYKDKDKWDYLILIDADKLTFKTYYSSSAFVKDISNKFDIRLSPGSKQPAELAVTNFKF